MFQELVDAGVAKRIIVDDCPDGCAPMLRYKSATSDVLIDTRPANVLYDETSVCFAHSIHNLGRAALNEAGVVGHVHAVTCVFGLNHHRKDFGERLSISLKLKGTLKLDRLHLTSLLTTKTSSTRLFCARLKLCDHERTRWTYLPKSSLNKYGL